MNTSSASLSASESTGFFGAYGGQFVPDDLKARLDEVTEAFDRYSDNSFFKDELDYYFKHYTGRPNPIFFCAHPLRQQTLAQRIVDLVRAEMVQILTLEEHAGVKTSLFPQTLGKARRIGQR